MRLISKEVINNNQLANDLTRQNFARVLGERPYYMGILATMKQGQTFTVLTDRLRNTFGLEQSTNKYQSVTEFMYDWAINIEYIKKVRFAEDNTNDGANRCVVTVFLQEKYYDKYDVIQLMNRQQLSVVDIPRMIHANRWEYKVRLVDPSGQRRIDTNYTKANDESLWITNAFPEVSTRGYYKQVSNIQRYRNYLSAHRTGSFESSVFKMTSALYFEDKVKGADGTSQSHYYVLEKPERAVVDQLIRVRDAGCVYMQTNYDQQGKCTEQDDDGQDIPKGDGLIQQVEKYGDKTIYARMTLKKIKDALKRISDKAENHDGNIYTWVCNKIQYDEIQDILTASAEQKAPNGGWYYSIGDVQGTGKNMAKLNMIKAGVTWSAYEIYGNVVNFIVDKSLSEYFRDKGYGLMIDTTPNRAEGEPTLKMMTLKGKEIVANWTKGAGYESGEVSTQLTGHTYSAIGYAGAMLANPTIAHIIYQSRR